MDKIANPAYISKTLYMRGMHRMFGNPSLGTFTGFLTAIFLIRVVANLYLIVDFSNRGGNIDVIQIISGLFLYLSAYAIGVGSFAAYRISFSLPALCFLNFSPGGKIFRSTFVKKILFLRPINILALISVLISVLISSLIGHNLLNVLIRALITLFVTFLSIRAVLAVLLWSSPEKLEIQIIESLSLLLLVVINPDIIRREGFLIISFSGYYYSFGSFLNMLVSISLVAIFSVFLILLLKIFTNISTLIQDRLNFSIIEAWYWRIFHVKFWILLYTFVIPSFVFPFFTLNVKLWILFLYILFSTLSYVYFFDQCEVELNEKLRCNLLRRVNLKLFTRSILSHSLLTMFPVIFFIFGK